MDDKDFHRERFVEADIKHFIDDAASGEEGEEEGEEEEEEESDEEYRDDGGSDYSDDYKPPG